MEKNHPVAGAGGDSHPGSSSEAGGAPSSARAWLAVASVALGAFAFVTTEFLPVGLLPEVARDLGVSARYRGADGDHASGDRRVFGTRHDAGCGTPGPSPCSARVVGPVARVQFRFRLCAQSAGHADRSRAAGRQSGRFLDPGTGGGGTARTEQHAARANAIILTGVTLATVIGVPLGTFISGLLSWRASFVATGVLAAVAPGRAGVPCAVPAVECRVALQRSARAAAPPPSA